jgi:hypothetical protein
MMDNEGIGKRGGDGFFGFIHLTTSPGCNLPKDRRLAVVSIDDDTAGSSGNRPDC